MPGADGTHFPVVVGQVPVFLLVGHQGPPLAPGAHPQPWCMGLSWQLSLQGWQVKVTPGHWDESFLPTSTDQRAGSGTFAVFY